MVITRNQVNELWGLNMSRAYRVAHLSSIKPCSLIGDLQKEFPQKYSFRSRSSKGKKYSKREKQDNYVMEKFQEENS